MIRTPPQHNTTHPPGQIVTPIANPTQCDGCAAGVPVNEFGHHRSPEYGVMSCSHPAAEKYRQTTYKGLYLRDVIKRIQENEQDLSD